jgi:integrase
LKKKLTVKEVKALKPPVEGETFVWDEELPCFGVKLTPTRATYLVQRRVKGRTVKHVIGRVDELPLQEARLKAMRALADLGSGTDLNQKKKAERSKAITLGQVFSDFMASKKLRSRTVQTYEQNMRWGLSDWRSKPVVSITKEMVEKRHKKLSNSNGPRGKGEASANQVMALLRSLMNYAACTYEDEKGNSVLPDNPVKRLSQIKAWNEIHRRQDVIHGDDLKAWYQATLKLNNPLMRDYFVFCLLTGLRRTEAAQLKWGYVDTKATVLTIPAEVTKANRPHQLPLTPFLLALLESRAKVRRIDNDYVFPADEGKGHMVEPKRAIAAVCDASGVKWSMHTLRRTFETTAESLDISYYALKRLLNHSIKSDVTSGYIVTNTERLREPMNKIGNYLETKMGIRVAEEVATNAQSAT